jgi:hypothetical protein
VFPCVTPLEPVLAAAARGAGACLEKVWLVDETQRYRPGREELHIAQYDVYISTGLLLPPAGKFRHFGMAAVYEQTAEGTRQVHHGIEGVYGRTSQEAARKMKEAIRAWIHARQSQKKWGQKDMSP